MVLSVKSDSGNPYQCSIPRSPMRAASTMFDRATPICARCVVVPRWSLFASSMRAEDFGIEDGIAGAEDLETVGAFLRNPLRELAGLLGTVDRSAVPLLPIGEDVGKEARRYDLVSCAALALMQAPVDAVAASRLAHARHAVRHPQLEH